jgi:hypothetical protein
MSGIDLFRPLHLAVFAFDPATRQPATRLPLYAEVGVPLLKAPTPPLDDRLRELLRAALSAADPNCTGACRDRVEAAVTAALAERLDLPSRNRLHSDFSLARSFFEKLLNETRHAAGDRSLADLSADDLKRSLDGALTLLAPGFDLTVVAPSETVGTVWAYPLGVLVTDHVGYASFDLTRLSTEVYRAVVAAIAARRKDPQAELELAVWVHPADTGQRFDALTQGRFADDAIVMRLEAPSPALPTALQNMGPRSMQNPSLADWRLSPSSFASSPSTLVGADGCETLMPASLALQEFIVRQVVRISDPTPDIAVPQPFRPAYVDEYKVSWFSLGHSLGEILYSLPLAPGENVKLAVIDWSWDSLTKRDETTKLTEDILHQTHRDRTITETVKAGLKEFQHGSSFMGGVATSAGASGSYGAGGTGIGGAIGNAWSLGGSTASSEGSRELAAENVQRLSDSFAQASSSQRELNSTVVIQARQEEKEAIQTRTFANYNHSHTLTILYYEVLRHFRMTVEWVRRRHAVLVKLPARVDNFDTAFLLSNRQLFEPVLLDPALKPAFATLAKLETIREFQNLHGIVPNDHPAPPFWEGDLQFLTFEIGIRTKDSDESSSPVVVYVMTADQLPTAKRFELHYVYKGGHMGEDENQLHNINSGERFNIDSGQWTFTRIFDQETGQYVSIKWKDIVGFQFEKWGTNDWRIDFMTINAFGLDGVFVPLTEGERDVDLYFLSEEPSSQTFTWIKRPGPRPAPPPPVLSPEKSLTAEENHLVKALFAHFDKNKDYYNSVLMIAADTNSIAIAFESTAWTGGKTLADVAEPVPLDVFGSYVAYPLAKQNKIDGAKIVALSTAINGSDPAQQQWAIQQLAKLSDTELAQVLDQLQLVQAKSERLVSLPTRGIFAEGKLGHCNLSEEIDNTRFWKWEEHPIPLEAAAINPVTPVTPSPQPVSASPTPFPQSLLNIVNPSPAPDPSGLAAALTAISTPNIFRDMSGRQEVADLLKKLSDNTIAIADAANRARDIQAKYGSASAAVAPTGAGAGAAPSTPGSGGAVRTPTPQPSPSQQQDQLQLWRSAARNGDITDEQRKDYAGRYLQNASLPGGGSDLPIGYGTDGQGLVGLSDLGTGIVRVIQHLDAKLAETGVALSATVRSRIEALRQEAILLAGNNQFMGETVTNEVNSGAQAMDKAAADLKVQLAVPIVVAGVAVTAAEAALLLAIAALAAILVLVIVSPEARAKATILKSKILDLAGEVVAGSTVEVDALRERVRRCREQPGPKSQACLDALAEFDKASATYNTLRQDLMDAVRRVVGDLTQIADIALIKKLVEDIRNLVSQMHTLADNVRTACNCVWG